VKCSDGWVEVCKEKEKRIPKTNIKYARYKCIEILLVLLTVCIYKNIEKIIAIKNTHTINTRIG